MAGVAIEPGLWESTSAVVGVSAPNLPIEVQRRMIGPRPSARNCITPEQAARPDANFLAARAGSRCRYRDFSMRGGRIRRRDDLPRAGLAPPDGSDHAGPVRTARYALGMRMETPMPDGVDYDPGGARPRPADRPLPAGTDEGRRLMIGYVTLGTNDLDKARAFYDALLGEIGATRKMEFRGDRLHALRHRRPAAGDRVTRPYDGNPASAGNGNMAAIAADSRETVDRLHARALELGGSDDGAPGLRTPEGPGAFYGAYFRDLDGNKSVPSGWAPLRARR